VNYVSSEVGRWRGWGRRSGWVAPRSGNGRTGVRSRRHITWSSWPGLCRQLFDADVQAPSLHDLRVRQGLSAKDLAELTHLVWTPIRCATLWGAAGDQW